MNELSYISNEDNKSRFIIFWLHTYELNNFRNVLIKIYLSYPNKPALAKAKAKVS